MCRTFLRGERVALRPPVVDDLDDLARIFQEPEVARWWPRFDRTRIQEDLIGNEEPTEHVYAVVVGDVVAGIVQAAEEDDPDYRSVGIDIAIATRWHGSGVAVDAIRTLVHDLIDSRGHHHVTIDPAADNARAIRCYEKLGFKAVGILRQNERGANGAFHDTLLMDLVAEELT